MFLDGPLRHKQNTRYAYTFEEKGYVVRVIIADVPAYVCGCYGDKEFALT